jgi:hypothetical protein
VVTKTTHKDGTTFTHDFGADLRKPYVVEDRTKELSLTAAVFADLIEEWKPVVVKVNTVMGARNGKLVYEPRHFYEDIEVYDPNHPDAAKEGASKGKVGAHDYFRTAVGTPIEMLRARVHAYGREPFDDLYNIRTKCSNWFKDFPQVSILQDSVTDYEIIFWWPAYAAQPDCMWGGAIYLHGPSALPKGKPNPRAYAGPMFGCRIAVRIDYTGVLPKITTTGRTIDSHKCLYTLDSRSSPLW